MAQYQYLRSPPPPQASWLPAQGRWGPKPAIEFLPDMPWQPLREGVYTRQYRQAGCNAAGRNVHTWPQRFYEPPQRVLPDGDTLDFPNSFNFPNPETDALRRLRAVDSVLRLPSQGYEAKAWIKADGYQRDEAYWHAPSDPTLNGWVAAYSNYAPSWQIGLEFGPDAVQLGRGTY
jgi:hypothetical protein